MPGVVGAAVMGDVCPYGVAGGVPKTPVAFDGGAVDQKLYADEPLGEYGSNGAGPSVPPP